MRLQSNALQAAVDDNTAARRVRTIVAIVDTLSTLRYSALDNISHNQSKLRPT
jgi:hypothetical protein